jgi:hypothetical protein
MSQGRPSPAKKRSANLFSIGTHLPIKFFPLYSPPRPSCQLITPD